MRKLLCMLACIISLQSFSQSNITGKVLDNSNKPLRGSTVLLLKQKDTSLVKSALTNEQGEYRFEGIREGKYAVKVSTIGFQTDFKKVDVSNANAVVADIILKTDAKKLQDVTVTAAKPFLEQRADKLVVNVENSATAAGSTALEILQKVPGVMVINDKVSIVGKNSVTIMIDGRSSPYQDMSQVLRDMSASNIEKIELITNPSAKYDASGGAIINIILKRNANLGTNGSIVVSGVTGLYDRGKNVPPIDRNFYRISEGFSLNHRKNKWNVFGGYSFLHRNFFTYNEFDREVNGSMFYSRNYTPNDVNSHAYRAGADFYADKKNTFGILVRGFDRVGSSETNNNILQTKISNGQMLSSFTTRIVNKTSRTNLATNFNWKHTFDTTGRDLNFDFDYATFQIDNRSDIFTLANGSQSLNNQVVDNPVKYATVKLDYSHPFNKETKLEMGVKGSFAHIDNFLVFRRNGVVDVPKSVDFLYKENINAAYATFQKKLDAWEFLFGVRTEQTVAKGNSAAGKVLDRNYWQLFPSAFITRKLNKNFSTVAQYSRRVNRPSYQQQNPFVEYLDSLTYTRGNPLIKPELTDAAKLSLTYQGQPFFSFSYNKTKDVIFQNAPKQEGNITYASPENLAMFENMAFELNFPLKFGKKITGYGGNQFIYNHYKADYLSSTYNQDKWHWMAYGQVSFKASPTLNIEASGFYMTGFLNEFLIFRPTGNLNFAVQKSFWEKKGRVTLAFNDVLYTNVTSGMIDYQEIKLKYHDYNESRNVRLTFSYSFGNQKLIAARNRSTGSDTEANRVKTN